MLATCKCYTRHCKNYQGIIQPDGTEMSEKNACRAFPDGIPDYIAYGEIIHDKPIKDQGNVVVFEKGKFDWED
jgi:hypothetical protein